MDNETNQPETNLDQEENQETQQNPAQELELLKQRARLMGITFSNNIGLESLRERVSAKMSDDGSGTKPDEVVDAQANPLNETSNTDNGPEKKLSKKQTLRQRLIAENMRLIRVRITCLDPKKKDLPGEILTVGNEYIGMVRKYVPYGEFTDEGYHIPYVLYKHLNKRRFLNIRTKKDRRTGVDQDVSSYAKEFAIEILPQLTPEELERLATAQAAAGSLND